MSIYVVRGADPVLRSRATADLVDGLLGADDRSLAVETFDVPATKEGGEPADASRSAVVAAIVNAAQSPPFMTAHRIVIVRDYEALTAAEAEPIVSVLDDLLDTTVLVFVSAGAGRVAKALGDALKPAETVGSATTSTADALAEALAEAELTFRNDASAAVVEHLGEDAGRVAAVVDLLASTYGPGSTLTADEVRPYLGESGSVPAYELTNRIEAGDIAGSLDTLHRLLSATSSRQAKAMHPLQALGLVHARYKRLLRLDDPSITSTNDAHAVLGGKGSTYPAKKALEASRALGSDGLRTAVEHLQRADIELKGATALPEDAVLEVLVARLAALHGRRTSGAARSRGRGARR
jgi:DNA polymerase-3 subunit delta